MGLVIADETSHFSVTHGTGIVDRYPKNSVAMRRNDDTFILSNGGDQQRALFTFKLTNISTVGGSLPADDDALETALYGIIFQ